MQINPKLYASVFAVPGALVDEYLKTADGDSIKVILYILRNGNAENVSKYLGISDERTDEILEFWQKMGVIGNADTPLHTPEIKAKRPKLSPSEISEKINRHPQIKSVFDIAEGYFSTKLNAMQCNSLVWLSEEYGYVPETFALLIDFCCQRDKLNWKYIETVAIDWAERNIKTVPEITAEVERLLAYYQYASVIRRLFFLNYPITSGQKVYAEKWQSRGYREDILKCAYEKTVENIGKTNFKYIDNILEDWYKLKLKTVTEVEKYYKQNPFNAAKYKQSKKVKSKPRSYDLDDVYALF